jgi:hypothetical protein
MIRRSGKLSTLLAAALSMAVASASCSKGGDGNPGSVSLALSIPGGFTVTSVDYSVKSGGARDPGGKVEVEQEVLAERFAGRQSVLANDLA